MWTNTLFGLLSQDLVISNSGIYRIQAALSNSQQCLMLRISCLSVVIAGRSASLGTATKFPSKQALKPASKPWHPRVCICYRSRVETRLTW